MLTCSLMGWRMWKRLRVPFFFFHLVFSLVSFDLRPPSLLKNVSRECDDEPLATKAEESVKEHLSHLDACKIPNIMHPGVLGQLADVTAGLPSVIIKTIWLLEKVTDDWKEANIMSILRRIHWTSGQSPPPVSLEKWCSRSWKVCLNRGRTRRSLQTASVDLPRTNHTDQPDCLLW